MPHGTETTTDEQRESSFVKDEAWQRKYKDIVLVPCKPITTDILTSLYRREGICNDEEDLLPFVKATHRRFVLSCFERDARIIDKIIARHDTMFTLASYFQIPAGHGVVNILHQYLKVSSESSAGEDGIDSARALDQLVCEMIMVFRDRCEMMKFLLGEIRRWGGMQLLNHVFFERTGRVKWMPEASSAVPSPVRQTFFHTVQASSSSFSVQHIQPADSTAAPDAAPQPAVASIFNTGLETLIESIMRLSVSGPAPIRNDMDEFGNIGGMGLQRRPRHNEMPISAPIPHRDHLNQREIPIARRWTVVREPENQHKDAMPYSGRAFTEQDWDLGPIIWRCALCEHQWYTVNDLEHRDEGIICQHCNHPLSKFDRQSLYNAPAKQLAKSPPASNLDYLPRAPFAPLPVLMKHLWFLFIRS